MAIVLEYSGTQIADSGTATSYTGSIGASAGDTVVFAVAAIGDSLIFTGLSVTTDQSQSADLIVTNTNLSASAPGVLFFVIPSLASGTTQFTLNSLSNLRGAVVHVLGYSGVDTSTPTGATAFEDSIPTGSITATTSGSLCLAMSVQRGGADTWTANTDSTLVLQADTGGTLGYNDLDSYLVKSPVSSTGSETYALGATPSAERAALRFAAFELLPASAPSGNDLTDTQSDTATISDANVQAVGKGESDTATISDAEAKSITKGISDTVSIADERTDDWTPPSGGLPSYIAVSDEGSFSTLVGGQSFPLPSGIQSGDLLILFVMDEGAYSGSMPTVSGWTFLGYYGRDQDTSYYSSITVFYVVADANTATSNPQVSSSFDPVGDTRTRCVLVRGGTIGQIAGNFDFGTTFTSYAGESITTAQDNNLILQAFYARSISTTGGISSDVETEIARSSEVAWTEHYIIGYQEQLTAGATDVVTYTSTGAMNRPVTVAIEIEGVPVSGGTDFTHTEGDTATISDANTQSTGKGDAETTTVSDALAVSATATKQDTANVSDAVSFAVTRNLSDTAAIADAEGKGVTTGRADTANVSDNASPELVIGGTDLTATESDTANISDSVSFAYSIVIEETISTTDGAILSPSVVLQETASIADSPGKAFGTTLDDSATFSDAFNRVADFYLEYSDVATLSENSDNIFSRANRELVRLAVSNIPFGNKAVYGMENGNRAVSTDKFKKDVASGFGGNKITKRKFK